MTARGPGSSGHRPGTSGHRLVPHTADVRVEAWGASRERCLMEAVRGMVGSFADVSAARATSVVRLRLDRDSDDDLLTALLDEVVFRLDVHGHVPVDVGAESVEGGLDVRLEVADLAEVEVIGAAPKGVSWQDLRIGPDPYGWSCAVTIDV
ncbi:MULTISPECIES: archease [Streptomyces]|uniref:Protein archease n=1 Tax=Streptomyces dengpaensis TaxID=2049881 RepID=A0ABM6SPD3_9ACTN|nr:MULTISPECIES: archease [Streptomyces]AVH56507.1 protein archease [Streptomyces dengpaensis]PIB10468.1 protein archease [Streptomyces sp. HG99]